MSKIFISHSSANNAQALAVAQWLKENGWGDYFLDITPDRGLVPGQRWQESLKTAADRCEAVLFLISPAWRDSRWCLTEFLLAKQLGKTIFGVLIEPTPLETLLKEMTAEWQLCDLVEGSDRHVYAVHSDPVVPHTEVSFAKVGLHRLQIGIQKSGLDSLTFPWPPPNDLNRMPYCGLKPLEAEDAAVFFGREAAIVRGLDALRRLRERSVEKMFVILGASGSGKSSFLRAGLWPRLKRNDHHFLPLPIIRPERAVISGPAGLVASLEIAFRNRGVAKTRAGIRKTLGESDGFDRLLTELQFLEHSRQSLVPEEAPPAPPAPPALLIAIDQGEELFGADGRAEAETFLSLLGGMLTPHLREGVGARSVARQNLFGLIVIRSDSYEWLQTEPKLQKVGRVISDLRPLAREEYKMVIEGPAARASEAGQRLMIEPALTEQLLNDAEGADALPLLAFTLERLFVEYGGDGDLRLDEYESLGGLRGSINAAVEAAFANPEARPVVPSDKMQRERLLRQGFIPWLARVDPETELRKRRVASWEEIPPSTHPLLERLIEARLLIRDRRMVEGGTAETVLVEIAHEALLRQWPMLSFWLDEDAEALKTADMAKRAAGEWTKNGRSGDWLTHGGERLDAAESLLKQCDFQRLLGEEGKEYLEACRDKESEAKAERDVQIKRIAEEQERTALEQKRTARLQRWSTVLFVVIGIGLVSAGSGMVLQMRQEARQFSHVLATTARAASDAGYFDQALRMAVLAARASWLSPSVPAAEAQLARAAHASQQIAQLTGHQHIVNSATFSPDGARVVTASVDQTARVWDAHTGKLLKTFTGHQHIVDSAIFSPDGARVVTASWDKSARVWEVHSGKLLKTLIGHEDSVFSATFSPDGARVVTASGDQTARVWEAHSGKLLETFTGHQENVNSATFSPDGTRVVTASWDQTARVWEVHSGKLLKTLKGHQKSVNSATFSPDGAQVVTASWDKTARVWEVHTGKLIKILTGHQEKVNSATFSPDGARVITASADQTARVWEAHNDELRSTLTGHEDSVFSATFSPDGAQVITASADQTTRVWEVHSGKLFKTFIGHEGSVFSATLSPDGARVITASGDQEAQVWDADSGEVLATLSGHQESINSATFSPDGAQVVTASEDQTARVWVVHTGKLFKTLTGHHESVNSATFSPDGARVVTASEDQKARVWEVYTGKLLKTLTGHQEGVNSATFSPDGARVVTASADQTARVWEVHSGKLLKTLTGHHESVNSAIFSPDGARVVTASADQTARVWDADSGELLATLTGHQESVNSATFSPDGAQVITASADQTLRVWEVSWLTQFQSAELIEAVCRNQLTGVQKLTQKDVRDASVLPGREGENVCSTPSLLTQLAFGSGV